MVRADTVEAAEQAFAEASERDGLSVIVSKMEPFGPPSFAMDINLLENRFEFARYLQSLASLLWCDWAILPLIFASPSVDMLGYQWQTRCELEKKSVRHEFQWQQKTLS